MNNKELSLLHKNFNDAKLHAENPRQKESISMKKNDHDFDEMTVEKNARKEWASSPHIRAEFTHEEQYVAFCVADAKGRVHILGSNSHGFKA